MRAQPAGWPARLTRLGVGLRIETPDDAPFLRQLYHDGRAAEVAGAGWSPTFAARFLDEQQRLQNVHYATRHPGADRHILTAAVRGAEAVAIGRLYLDRSAAEWRLLEIGLLADWQGCGTGAAVVGWIQRAAAAAGARAVTLHVLNANVRAAALYARLGFIDTVSLAPTHRAMRWQPG